MLCSYSNYVYGPFLCNKSGCDFCSIEYHPQFHRMAALHIFVHILNHTWDPHSCQRQIQQDNIEEGKGLKREEVATLIENGFKVHDKHPDTEGQEIDSSGQKSAHVSRRMPVFVLRYRPVFVAYAFRTRHVFHFP